MSLTYQTFLGPEISDVIDRFAELRIAVFREWPYLYDGDLDYERSYLQSYAQGETILIGAFSGSEMVGASTGMPLRDHADEIGSAFQDLPYNMNNTFYCAESVVLKAHRGGGSGQVFFDRREAHARSLGFTFATFCAVIRETTHPARPSRYRPLSDFWTGLGYEAVDGAHARLSWRDLGETEETEKELQVWVKAL